MYQSWVEISKSAILHNLRQYQKIVGKRTEVMPIVKSNAYGHGMVEVAKIVAPKVNWIGVASLGEALELRRNNIHKKIFVLSYAPSSLFDQGIKQNIDLPIYDLANAEYLDKIAGKLKKKARVHIKIDTGATRIGILPKDASELINKIKSLPDLNIVGIYSHFAASEENRAFTRMQLNNFKQVLNRLDLKIPYKHFGCSAATLTEPDSHFNLIRLGLGLYGLWPSESAKKIAGKKYLSFSLRPALKLYTKIVQVKEIPKGTKIGYGCTYTAKKKMKIAVLAVGYWEGYDRHLSNIGMVIIKNKKCPVVGRVCMNLTMVDVSKVKSVRAGDSVLLLGPEMPAEELAEKAGTINYEIVTRINLELKRIYK